MCVKMVNANFPDWASRMPSEHDNRVLVGRSTMIESTKAVMLAASSETSGIVISYGREALSLSSKSSASGDSTDEINAECTGKSIFGVSGTLITSALGSMSSDSVSISSSGELDPIIITPIDDTDRTVIVMPMRM